MARAVIPHLPPSQPTCIRSTWIQKLQLELLFHAVCYGQKLFSSEPLRLPQPRHSARSGSGSGSLLKVTVDHKGPEATSYVFFSKKSTKGRNSFRRPPPSQNHFSVLSGYPCLCGCGGVRVQVQVQVRCNEPEEGRRAFFFCLAFPTFFVGSSPTAFSSYCKSLSPTLFLLYTTTQQHDTIAYISSSLSTVTASACMAGPPDNQRDVTMLEVIEANTNTSARNHPSRRQILPFANVNRDNGHRHAPIMISMSQEEYTARHSRESVLQRLSEALLRRSLTKVGSGGVENPLRF
jgi:hypothetical protein